MKVTNLQTANGKPAPNQFEIIAEGKRFFQSYETLVAYEDLSTGEYYRDKNAFDYSNTTTRYLNIFSNRQITKNTPIKTIEL